MDTMVFSSPVFWALLVFSTFVVMGLDLAVLSLVVPSFHRTHPAPNRHQSRTRVYIRFVLDLQVAVVHQEKPRANVARKRIAKNRPERRRRRQSETEVCVNAGIAFEYRGGLGGFSPSPVSRRLILCTIFDSNNKFLYYVNGVSLLNISV